MPPCWSQFQLTIEEFLLSTMLWILILVVLGVGMQVVLWLLCKSLVPDPKHIYFNGLWIQPFVKGDAHISSLKWNLWKALEGL